MRKFSQVILSRGNPLLKQQNAPVSSIKTNLFLTKSSFNANQSVMRSFSSKKDGKTPSSAASSSSSPVVSKPKTSIMQTCQSDVASLATKEIQNLNENIVNQTSEEVDNQEVQQWLNKSGYTIAETSEEITLVKTDKSYSVSLKFSPYPEEGEDLEDLDAEETKDFTDSDEENESGSESASGDEKSTQIKVKPLSLKADITFNNVDGTPKGVVSITGEVAADNRIYINQLQALPLAQGQKFDKMPDLPFSMFEALSQDIQDRIYDLLDEVGIDDKMGSYIRFYSHTFEDRQSIAVLENINKIFSN